MGFFKNNFKKKMYAPRGERERERERERENAFAMRLLTRLIVVVDREEDYCLNWEIHHPQTHFIMVGLG